LIGELKRRCSVALQVWFLSENATQNWKLDLPDYCRIADENPARLARLLMGISRESHLKLIHLGGWGGDARLSALIAYARILGIPLFIESDTQQPFEEAAWKRAVKRLLYPVLFRLPRAFLPGGTRQAEYLASFGVRPDRIRIVRMTSDVTSIMAFSDEFGAQPRRKWRESLGFGPEETIFLFVGRLVDREKRVAQLLKSFATLAGVHPNARLVMVGDGPMRSAVERCATSANWLVYLGRLEGAQLLSAYCSSDALVLPSRFESWGLVVNEAMAAGLPTIVSSRVGCASDLVEGRETGIVYDYSREDGLFEAMVAMLRSADVRRNMGESARALISSWTLEEEAERVIAAWEGAG
jgi:glycosyltransferase involved in cell wall biosynthesis